MLDSERRGGMIARRRGRQTSSTLICTAPTYNHDGADPLAKQESNTRRTYRRKLNPLPGGRRTLNPGVARRRDEGREAIRTNTVTFVAKKSSIYPVK